MQGLALAKALNDYFEEEEKEEVEVLDAQQVQKELAGTGSGPVAAKTAKPKGPDLGAHLHRIQSNLRQHFATQVTLQHTPKKGRIEIEYYGDDDLGRILELLGIEAE